MNKHTRYYLLRLIENQIDYVNEQLSQLESEFNVSVNHLPIGSSINYSDGRILLKKEKRILESMYDSYYTTDTSEED